MRTSVPNPRTVRATHVAWSLANGPVPRGLYVLHKCDTPACVRPDHLRVGTQKENIQDALQKGRIARGARLPQTKLTDADIRGARWVILFAGVTKRRVAQAFNVNYASIWRALRTPERGRALNAD